MSTQAVLRERGGERQGFNDPSKDKRLQIETSSPPPFHQPSPPSLSLALCLSHSLFPSTAEEDHKHKDVLRFSLSNRFMRPQAGESGRDVAVKRGGSGGRECVVGLDCVVWGIIDKAEMKWKWI